MLRSTERSRGTGPRTTVKGKIARDRPPHYEKKRAPYRRARACPSPCYWARERSRGTGPRATVKKKRLPYRRARACPSPCYWTQQRSRGTGPRATIKNAALTVGRGPVPRHAGEREKSRGTGPRATVKKETHYAKKTNQSLSTPR